MHHHRHIDVVEGAQPDELLLAGHQPQLALLVQIPAVLDVDELLGGHRHQRHVAGQGVPDVRRHEPDGNAEHHAYLAVVATRMGRARLRVGMGVLQHSKRVELANHGDRGARPAAAEVTLDPREGDASLVGNAQLVELLANVAGGLDLVEPRLRVIEDGPRDVDEPVPALVYGRLHLRLELFDVRQYAPPALQSAGLSARPCHR